MFSCTFSSETKDIDEVKETKEDGTADEKQKLTEAEETPAEDNKETEVKGTKFLIITRCHFYLICSGIKHNSLESMLHS